MNNKIFLKKIILFVITVSVAIMVMAGCDKKEEVTCTVSINCKEILNNMDKFDTTKQKFVPEDGWILKPTEIKIEKGQSAFDVLLSVCKEQKIHMEHSYTPLLGCEYIQGINQIYEFDCGDMSGWSYLVDGESPNSGCDQYILSGGEQIEFVYICDMGMDME